MDEATIYALGTPTPSRAHPGALSVIRLSGPRAADALVFLTERKAFERGHSAREPALPEPRRLALRTMLDPLSGVTPEPKPVRMDFALAGGDPVPSALKKFAEMTPHFLSCGVAGTSTVLAQRSIALA